jgi:hypothetical protein
MGFYESDERSSDTAINDLGRSAGEGGGGRGDSTLWLGCCTTISGLIPACYPSFEKYNAGVKRKKYSYAGRFIPV